MTRQTAVRIKGSSWQAFVHRSTRDTRFPTQVTGTSTQASTTPKGEDGMLLDLATRHFIDAGLTSNEAKELAGALEQVIMTGETATFFPASSAEHAYEISRRRAVVAISIDGLQIRLPVHAAKQLADVLIHLRMPSTLQDIAA